jgi:tetratricopeptide (TPR) repeat protein
MRIGAWQLALGAAFLLASCAGPRQGRAVGGEGDRGVLSDGDAVQAALLDPTGAAPTPPGSSDGRRGSIELPAAVVTVSKEDLELVGLDAAQLFDCGSRAFPAADFQRAARCYDRLVDLHPTSTEWQPALYNAALAHERMGDWAAALERWARLLARFPAASSSGPSSSSTTTGAVATEEADATFHAALCEHELGRLQAAAARLHRLSARSGLAPGRRAEALVQEAVCRIEDAGLARAEQGCASCSPIAGGRLEGRAQGERLLRAALALGAPAGLGGEGSPGAAPPGGPESELDPALLAQAEYWIGEVYRSYFAEVLLDPSGQQQEPGPAGAARASAPGRLEEALESKAQLLLSAQGHYLRAIRRGDGEWATASGYRIGELYEELHRQMTEAPVPAGLDSEHAAVYREELAKKVRVLLEKAMKVYDSTLATAQRVNARSDFVERTAAALQRMRALLLATPSARSAASAPAPKRR